MALGQDAARVRNLPEGPHPALRVDGTALALPQLGREIVAIELLEGADIDAGGESDQQSWIWFGARKECQFRPITQVDQLHALKAQVMDVWAPMMVLFSRQPGSSSVAASRTTAPSCLRRALDPRPVEGGADGGVGDDHGVGDRARNEHVCCPEASTHVARVAP